MTEALAVVFGAAIVLVTDLIRTSVGNRAERKRFLRDQRLNAYVEFQAAASNVANATRVNMCPSAEDLRHIRESATPLGILASTRVWKSVVHTVTAVTDYEQAVEGPDRRRAADDYKRSFYETTNSMRDEFGVHD